MNSQKFLLFFISNNVLVTTRKEYTKMTFLQRIVQLTVLFMINVHATAEETTTTITTNETTIVSASALRVRTVINDQQIHDPYYNNNSSNALLVDQQEQQETERELLFFNRKCPPKNYNSLSNFDLESYISKPWYAIKQIPLVYQPITNFYCVRADYIKDTSRCLFCRRNQARIKVYNQARDGSVTGSLGGAPYNKQSPPSNNFYGMQKNKNNYPARLTVGFYPQLLVEANYWIVAAGTYNDSLAGIATPSSNIYDWAIVSGNTASKKTENNKCIPNPGLLIDFLGMWMFARDGVPPPGVIDAIDTIASNMGLDTTKWLPVQQEGCIFNDGMDDDF